MTPNPPWFAEAVLQVAVLMLCGGIFTWGILGWLAERSGPRTFDVTDGLPEEDKTTDGKSPGEKLSGSFIRYSSGLAALVSGVSLVWITGNLILILAVVSPALSGTGRLPLFWALWAVGLPWLARLGTLLAVGLASLLGASWRAAGWRARERVTGVCIAAGLAAGLGVYWELLP